MLGLALTQSTPPSLGFTRLRDGLGLTDGNLGRHAAALEKAGYIEGRRALAGLHFEVRYRITPRGSAAFREYARALLDLLGDEAAPADAVAGAPPPASRAQGVQPDAP